MSTPQIEWTSHSKKKAWSTMTRLVGTRPLNAYIMSGTKEAINDVQMQPRTTTPIGR